METQHRAPGLTLHTAGLYDLTLWLMTRGRERALRESILDLVALKPGEAVLDVGCGTGGLAIVAKHDVGPTGTVHGIDASPEMLARATKKARRAGVEVEFTTAPAQALPFPDAGFDVVLSTIMLHHLPRPGRAACLREMRRVLRPGGRALVVEFAASGGGRLSHFHRHGHVELKDIVALVKKAGLDVTQSGAVGLRDMHYVVGTAPA